MTHKNHTLFFQLRKSIDEIQLTLHFFTPYTFQSLNIFKQTSTNGMRIAATFPVPRTVFKVDALQRFHFKLPFLNFLQVGNERNLSLEKYND